MSIRYVMAQAASLIVAVGIGILGMACMARAVVTVTAANAASISYILAPGTSTGAFGLATDQATYLIGECPNGLDVGVGQAALLHRSGGGISWTGLDANGTTTHASGASTTGAGIVTLNQFVESVFVEVNDADTIRIHNIDSKTHNGIVTLFW